MMRQTFVLERGACSCRSNESIHDIACQTNTKTSWLNGIRAGNSCNLSYFRIQIKFTRTTHPCKMKRRGKSDKQSARDSRSQIMAARPHPEKCATMASLLTNDLTIASKGRGKLQNHERGTQNARASSHPRRNCRWGGSTPPWFFSYAGDAPKS